MKKIFFKILIIIYGIYQTPLFSQQAWVVQSTPANVPLNSIKFVNENVGYCVGNDNSNGNYFFLKTTNGGINWFSQLTGINTKKCPVALFFTDSITGYSVGGDPWLLYPACFFKTTNGGINWVSNFFQDTIFLSSVFFSSQNTGFTCGGNKIYKTTNTGSNWSLLNSGASNALKSIFFTDNNSGYIAGLNGTIIKTTNSGLNWTSLQTNISTNLSSIFFINSNTGYTCGNSSDGHLIQILKTTNSGTNWISVLQEPTTYFFLYGIYFTTSDIGYVCGYEYNVKIFKTSNGGANWNLQEVPSLPPYTVARAIYFINSFTGYVCGGTTTSSVVLKTTTGGSGVPNPPNNLSGIYITNPKSIKLNWGDNSITETGFKIERKKISGSLWDIIDSVSQNTTTYNDLNLDSGINTYNYRVFSYNVYGNSPYSNTITIMTISSIHSIGIENTINYSLLQNYPNPYNPFTKIRFVISKKGNASLKIFDIFGNEIATLVNEQLKPGMYEVEFDGNNYASGVYYYKLVSGDFVETKKMVLMK